MSDVSLIPDDAWPVIQAGGQKPVLVIDCLRLRGHTSHMGLREAGVAIRRIGARRSYMTGFNHDVSQEEYVRIGEGREEGTESGTVREGIAMMREALEGEVHWVRPAHDGLRVFLGRDGRVWDETYT
jgi:phosphoribosyl 1,2-cyclic phosphodiesterase